MAENVQRDEQKMDNSTRWWVVLVIISVVLCFTLTLKVVALPLIVSVLVAVVLRVISVFARNRSKERLRRASFVIPAVVPGMVGVAHIVFVPAPGPGPVYRGLEVGISALFILFSLWLVVRGTSRGGKGYEAVESSKLVKEIISADGMCKATIKLRDDRTYQIDFYKFTHEVVGGYGEVCPPFWEPVAGEPKTIVDTLENAEKIAVERLGSVREEEPTDEIED